MSAADRSSNDAVPDALPGSLHCLGGKPGPDGLAADLRGVLRLPPSAAAELWSVLGPSLDEPLADGVPAMLDAFQKVHDLSNEDLARPLKACRFLLREAARLDLAPEPFAADVLALCPDAPEIRDLLLAGYASARARLRQAVLRGTLADHGNVLVGVDWRLESVHASSRSPKMSVPVATLTLRYRKGEKSKRITLQVLPETLKDLKGIFNQLAP